MDERWQQIKRIFEEASHLAPEKRSAFLEENCTDEEMRREAESLLVSADAQASFLEDPAIGEVAQVLVKEKEHLLTDQTFGRYKIISQIGAGGMGEVYLAEDLRLRRKVALKLLQRDISGDKDRLRRFEQEALAVSALNHPNILTVHEFGEENGVYFLTSEFVEGETLRGLLAKDEAPTLDEALDIASQVAAALSVAHEAGIIHRDIKPENVMIRRDQLVKVLDFGLAKLTQTRSSFPNLPNEERETLRPNSQTNPHPAFSKRQLTTPGMIMGTIRYLSPEQARGKTVDARSDLWSFGVMLYEMLTGRPPFEGETTSDVIAAILKTEAEPLPNDLPAELRRIVAKLLRHPADERYQTAKDLLADLKTLRQELDYDAKLERQSSSLLGRQQTAKQEKISNSTAAENLNTSSIRTFRKWPVIVISLVLLIAGAIKIYQLFNKPAANQPVATTTTATTPEKIDSLAVLPFENSTPENEYLADGIAESLINSMSSLPSLRVVSRSTAFNFKGTKETPQAIGKTLNVKAILTGKITAQGDSIIIQADLVNVENNSEIWGNRFSVKSADLSQIPQQIAQQITNNLQLRLTSDQQAQIARQYTDNAEAYREYLKGRFYTLQFTPEGHQKALDHLNKAIAIDPTYALAYAGIADAYTTVSDVLMSPHDALSKAKASAQKAIDLDNQLAEAYAARGHARLHEWDKRAIDDLNKAIALEPNTMTTYLWLGEYYMIFDPQQAVPVLQKAAELDPLSPLPPGFLSFIYVQLRQPEEAFKFNQKSKDLDFENYSGYYYYSFPYTMQGDYQSALEMLSKIPPEQSNPSVEGMKATVQAFQGKKREAEDILAKLLKQSEKTYISPMIFANIYVALGDRDKTFFWLNKAYEDRSEALGFIRTMFFFDSIRDDPRYQELIQRIGFDK